MTDFNADDGTSEPREIGAQHDPVAEPIPRCVAARGSGVGFGLREGG
jgi:hypothetical protein